ncbi:MAG: hypothetical protein KME32_35910 [Mojavia pulchra JT2-VF2]|jgi:hypothetical protein|uniref:Uncharacterized protein n=1 Tax=Mojavia pulchra JT2-VF2 TaxID=287848 RepID=A0A951Q6B5_9NOST|nr:hypothetical protein [Mojavia pulchra JT2-VF2]
MRTNATKPARAAKVSTSGDVIGWARNACQVNNSAYIAYNPYLVCIGVKIFLALNLNADFIYPDFTPQHEQRRRFAAVRRSSLCREQGSRGEVVTDQGSRPIQSVLERRGLIPMFRYALRLQDFLLLPPLPAKRPSAYKGQKDIARELCILKSRLPKDIPPQN